MYRLKRKIMNSIIHKRQIEKGLNIEYAENYILDINGDYSINNSYYFSCHNYNKKESLYIRLGERGDNTKEIWVYYNDSNNNIYYYKDLYLEKNIKESPLKVYKDKTTNNWIFDFNGTLLNLIDNKEHKVKLKGEFISLNKGIIDFFTNMPSLLTASAMAKEKWNKEFCNEVNKNNQVHYEEEGKVNVTIKIDNDKEESLFFNAVRDHSYGKRIWDYMNNHLWLSAINDDISFNFSMVSYPSITLLEVGNIRLNNGNTIYLKEAKYDLNEVIKGEVPTSFNLIYIGEDNKEIKVEIKILSCIPYKFEDGNYYLNEGIAEYKIEDKVSRGIFEIGFNKNKNRYFNNKDLRRIK